MYISRISDQEFAKIIHILLNDPDDAFDMQAIEWCFYYCLNQLKKEFISINELLQNSPEILHSHICGYTDTSDYFFDAINTQNISVNKILHLIQLTLKPICAIA